MNPRTDIDIDTDTDLARRCLRAERWVFILLALALAGLFAGSSGAPRQDVPDAVAISAAPPFGWPI